MKNRAKTGNKKGNPAYRTPAVFRYQKSLTRLSKPYAPVRKRKK